MGTKMISDNFSITVYPDDPSDLGYLRYPAVTTEEAWEERCREIQGAIKRHIDNVANVSVRRDRYLVCEFCEDRWDGAVGDKGEPYCCDKAQEEFIANNPQYDWTVFA